LRLKWHLVRLVLFALVPMVVLATVLIVVLVQQERSTRERGMQDVARGLALSIDSELQRSITALEVLALSTRLAGGDFDSFRVRAKATMALQPSWSNLLVYDSGGTPLLNLRIPVGEALPPLPHVETVIAAARTGRPQVSDLILGPMTGRYLTYVSVPVFVQGAVRYVVQATIYFDAWTAWLQQRTPDGWTTAIDDRNGAVLARSDEPERFVGRTATPALQEEYARRNNGIARIVGLPGLTLYVAYHRTEHAGWRALAIVPAEIMERGPYLTGLAWAGGAVAVLAAAACFAAWSAGRVTRDIRRLTHAIEDLGAGTPPGPVASDIGEVNAAGAAAANAGRLLADRAQNVAALQAKLAQRAEAAESVSQAKDRFIAMLSHELRNPLSAIANAVAVLKRRETDVDDPRSMVAILDRQTRHLTFLVNDLLDMSKLATGKVRLDLRDVDLAVLVHEVLETMQDAGRFADHPLHTELRPAPLRGDPERLVQVARNLLDNAVKFTPAGGAIHVAVGAENGAACLRVRDTGIGIDPAIRAQLFEPFVQGDQDLSRVEGGLGLGLAIVRRIVELHGGTVAAQSEGPGRGSEFVVQLPAADAAGEGTLSGDASPARQAQSSR
jgi:signal transduction histidine kinase